MHQISAETTEYKHLLYEVDAERICWLTLNRPNKINAMNERLLAELRAALLRADHDDDVNVIVIRGAGRGFCAGHDLEEDTSDDRSSNTNIALNIFASSSNSQRRGLSVSR